MRPQNEASEKTWEAQQTSLLGPFEPSPLKYPPEIRFSGRRPNEGSIHILRMTAEANDSAVYAVTWLPYDQRGADVLPNMKCSSEELRDFLSKHAHVKSEEIDKLLKNLMERRTDFISNVIIPAETIKQLGLG